MRDMQISAAMLSKLTIKVNRRAYNFVPGDLFRFKWPKLGIEQMVFRIGEIDYGTLNDSTITIEAMEDVYSLPSATMSRFKTHTGKTQLLIHNLVLNK